MKRVICILLLLVILTGCKASYDLEIDDIFFNESISSSFNYKELEFDGCLIYCDPPYKDTTKYPIIGEFNTEEFWNVMRNWSKNNTVIISEYEAPNDFECIKEINTKTDIRNRSGKRENRVERLFRYKM